MELEGGGGRRGGGEMNKQLQAQPPHQKCPRCDSFNTKFCYYNNYSLTQPRFFCKTCRRYWTQGGTLRNVPVGGGCRKGKRAKNSSLAASSSNSSGNSSLSQQPQLPSTMQQTVALSAKDSSSIMASLSSGVPFYQGGGSGGGLGFMSSFPAFNPMNPSSSSSINPFDQSLNVGGVGSSNLGLLQGFNLAATLGNSSQGQNRPSQFFQMGSGGNGMFNSEQQGLNLISQTGMVNTTSAVSAANAVVAANNDNWPQSFMSNGNNINGVSDPTLNWSNINTTSIVGVNSDGNGAGVGAGVGGSGSGAGGVSSSLVAPNQWADMSGFNPPQ